MHCYSNTNDTIIAESVEDAIEVWEEVTGESWARDYAEWDEFSELPDDHLIKIAFVEHDGLEHIKRPDTATVAEQDGSYLITATAAEWIKCCGRGLLASDEW